MKSLMTQHGDVLIKKVGKHNVFEKEFSKIPSKAKDLNTNLVLKGAMNSHALYGGSFKIFEHEGTTFIKVTKATSIYHVKDLVSMERAEHDSQVIPEGEYFVDQVNEFDHLLEESRKIID